MPEERGPSQPEADGRALYSAEALLGLGAQGQREVAGDLAVEGEEVA